MDIENLNKEFKLKIKENNDNNNNNLKLDNYVGTQYIKLILNCSLY